MCTLNSPRFSKAALQGNWRCGHPRTPENTQSVGKAGVRCRTCRQNFAREWSRAHAKRRPTRAELQSELAGLRDRITALLGELDAEQQDQEYHVFSRAAKFDAAKRLRAALVERDED